MLGRAFDAYGLNIRFYCKAVVRFCLNTRAKVVFCEKKTVKISLFETYYQEKKLFLSSWLQ